MKVKVFLVRSFAETAEGGNAAGVVLDADNLKEDDMKKIAKIIGYSETAFVFRKSLQQELQMVHLLVICSSMVR